MNRTILHVDADAFFASVEQAFNPNLRQKPVIVGGTENQRGVVHTASYEARQQGVYTGMPLRQAKRLIPDAVFLKGNFEHYQAIGVVFREIYGRYTPALEFTSNDDAYLDLTGTERVHNLPALEIARSIQKEVYKQVQVPVSCGIGSSKLIARLASGSDKPNGLTCITPGDELSFLHPLQVEMLPGIGRVVKATLNRLGIFTIGELSRLPKNLLIQLFGKNGFKYWGMAQGIDVREVEEKCIPKQISRETGFEEDTSDPNIVTEVLRYLTERIGKKLRTESLVTRTVAVKIDYVDKKHYRKERSLPCETSNTQAIFATVANLIAETPFRRVRVHRVGLAASNLAIKGLQGELFEDSTRQDALESAVDEIRERYGFMSVMPANLINLRKRYSMQKSGYILHAPALTQ